MRVTRSRKGATPWSNPKTEPTDNTRKDPDEWTLEASARKAGVATSIHRAGRLEDIADAIIEAKSGEADVALNVLATPLFFNNRALIFAKVAEVTFQLSTNGPKWPRLEGWQPMVRELSASLERR